MNHKEKTYTYKHNPFEKLIYTLLLLFITFQINGQTIIKGRIFDDTGAPVSYSSIVLNQDSVMVQGCVSSDNGSFQMKGNFTGDYTLKVSFIGYVDLEKDIKISSQKELDLGVLTLKTNVELLSEVVVTSEAVAKSVSVEKTSINASSSIGAATGSVLDILRSSASVSVDNSDNISIRGNSNILILIDGVPTSNTALATVPAGNVQKIDVITSPDVKYDSEGTGGIINIISKKNQNAGFSGMASFNYGFMNMLNGNVALGYNSKRWTLRFNYNGSYIEDEITSTLDRHLKFNGQSIRQDIHSNLTTSNNVIGTNATYRASEKDILSFSIKGMLPRNNNVQDFHNIYNEGASEKNRLTDITFNRKVVEASFGYKRNIEPDKQELSFLASASKTKGDRPSYYYENGQMVQKSVSGGSPLIASLQLDYMNVIGKGKLETGMKMTVRKNNIDHKFYEYDSIAEMWNYSKELSNDLQHREYIPAMYIMYSGKFSDKFSYNTGVRYEFSKVELSNHKDGLDEDNWNHFLSPELSFDYNANKNTSFAFRLSRRISRPTYPQLNPYINLIDNNTYETGNIYLKPETSNKIDLNFNYVSKIFNLSSTLYLNFIHDYITQVVTVNEEYLIMTYINGDWNNNKGIELLFKVKPTNWIDISINDNFYHTATSGTFEGAEIGNEGFVNSLNVALNFKPRKDMSIQAQYYYTTPQHFPQFDTDPIHYMDLSIRQSFLKNTLNISASVTDLFNTRSWNIYSDNAHYMLSNYSKNSSRILWLGITYNFNSFKPAGNKTTKEENRSLIRIGN